MSRSSIERPTVTGPRMVGPSTAPTTTRQPFDAVLVGLRGVLAVALIAAFVWQSFYDHAADFKSFYSAGYAVRHPEIPLYDLVALEENPFGEVFKLSPPAAVYLVPFSFGTVQQARFAWRIVLVVATVLAFAVVARMLGLRMLGWTWLIGLGLWCAFGPLQMAIGEGQWDPIFLLLIAVAASATASGSPTIAALAVALAASIKPYPIVLIGQMVARRAWRPVAVTALALSTMMLTCAAIVGMDEASAFITRVLPGSGATTAYADNQSLGGVLARAWSNDLKPLPLRDAATIDLTIRLCALAAFGATVWLVARQSGTDPYERALQLMLFVPLSILVIPAAWTHYQAILLVPLTLLAVDQARRRPREPIGWLLLVVAYVVLLLPNPTMLYGPEIDRGLWLRSRADGANQALQRLYPTGVSRLILSYKAFAVIVLYLLVAWRVSHPASRAADAGVPSSMPVPAGVRP